MMVGVPFTPPEHLQRGFLERPRDEEVLDEAPAALGVMAEEVVPGEHGWRVTGMGAGVEAPLGCPLVSPNHGVAD
jgi:hypothetical protein